MKFTENLFTKAVLNVNYWIDLFCTGAGINPSSDNWVADPYPYYKRLRENSPIHRNRLIKGYLISRYEDILEVFSNPAFTVDERSWYRWPMELKEREDNNIGNPYEEGLRSIGRVDGEEHKKLRKALSKSFSPNYVRSLAGKIREIANSLLNQVDSSGFDLITSFAEPLPVMVIAEVIGIPKEDYRQFKHWSNQISLGLGGRYILSSVDDMHRHRKACFEFHDYLRRVIKIKKTQPAEDLISKLLIIHEKDESTFSEKDLLGLLTFLLVAGNETTVNLIGNGTIALLNNPAQWNLLVEQREYLKENAIEELLRFDSPLQIARRFATQDTEFKGNTIKKGEVMGILIGSGNRDEDFFANGSTLDVTRQEVKHLAFGHGSHRCPGALLAKIEGEIAFNCLLDRYPNLKLTESKLDWSDNLMFRGVNSLPVKA